MIELRSLRSSRWFGLDVAFLVLYTTGSRAGFVDPARSSTAPNTERRLG